MSLVTTGTLARAFRGSTEAAYRQMLQRQQAAERERRDRKDEIEDDAAEFMDFALSVISIAEANEFRVELDGYDTATVAALQENDREIALSRERLDKLLAKAHVLPDGRRVFKTEDGFRVFDENGVELDGETIDPEMIADERPRWETYKPELDRFRELERQRAEVLKYQAKLDEARERLDRGDMTRKEFDGLRDKLKAEMPEAVRAQMPETEQEPDATALAEPTAPAEELDITADMVPTASAPKLPTPG